MEELQAPDGSDGENSVYTRRKNDIRLNDERTTFTQRSEA